MTSKLCCQRGQTCRDLWVKNLFFLPAAGAPDLPLLQRAQACCRGILQIINEVVRETEHRQRLSQYQRRLDAAPQFKVVAWSICDPPAPQVLLSLRFIHPFFYLVSQNLDLSTKRMIHEGPLTWKVNKDKQIGKKHELRNPLFLNYYDNTFFLHLFWQ